MSKAEAKQNINGILLVNKPKGLSSNGVLQRVKHLFHAKKAGHTGSLDPMATGMLPICFGEATKFCQYLLDADKCYETTALLGIKTNTADATGEIIARVDEFTLSEEALQQTIAAFCGKIKQIPSMFSALKHQGTPLYKYARLGVEIERSARDVSIHQLQVNRFDGQEIDLTVSCSKGTYIRNLVEDIGEQLGTYAHVTRLHRRYTAGFSDEPMYTLDELDCKSVAQLFDCLLPMDRAVNYLPSLNLDHEAVQALRLGKIINQQALAGASGCYRLYGPELQFVGLGDMSSDGVLKVRRLLNV